ncbi:MAG: PQQ-binding-like beta-propeller repeat protein [Saprospiraceae bacterium]|nr:PQQ-binding-like beta-propeller repeat protein [Candidatus Vicinibacter affinis]
MKNIWVALMLLTMSCDDYTASISDPPSGGSETTKLKLVWQTLLPKRPETSLSIPPVLYKDKVLVSDAILLSLLNDHIMAFKQDSGQSCWSWDDHYPDRKGETMNLSQTIMPVYQNIFMYTGSNLHGIDMNTGKSIWSIDVHSRGGRYLEYTRMEELAFFRYLENDGTESLVIVNMKNGSERKIYHADYSEDKPGFNPLVLPPAIQINQVGDTLLYFKTGYWSSPKVTSMACYNLTKSEMVWFKEDVDPNTEPNSLATFIKDGLVFTCSFRTIFCFNSENGEIVWKRDFSDKHGGQYMANSNLEFDDQNVYFIIGNGNIFSLNQRTGIENWKTDVPGVALGGIRCIGGKIIFSNRTLYIFDASNGKKLIEYDSSNESKEYFDTYISDPTYDPLTKRIYFSDGYFLQCFQLIE